MRPHEEDWDNGRDFEVTVSGPELDRGIDAPREQLARYAPDMARVLLRVGYGCMVADPKPDCQCMKCQIRAALTKAGVLP